MTTIATCALAPTYDVALSLERHLRTIDEAADRGAELVVFPETSLHGYPPDVPVGQLAAVLERVYAIAEPVPSGEAVQAIAARARERGIHVIYGLHEAGERRGIVYDTAVLTGPSGHVGCYRKVHVGVWERLIWRLGHEWPVFDTPLGRIGIAICWDKDFPEATRELTLRGADLLIVCSAWDQVAGADPDGISAALYDLYDRVRAAENGRWLVSANFVGVLGEREFIGMSQIVSPLGEVIATSGMTDAGLVLADLDIEDGIAAAYAAWEGPYLIRDRRPDTYGVLNGERAVVIEG